MVKNVRADPVNKTRQHITKYPLLKNMSDYDFPIIIVYGEKDIYGESKQYVKNRFPQAIFVEMRNAGHMAWKHAPEEFSRILVEFYKIS
jgi:proline iminopeptidase